MPFPPGDRQGPYLAGRQGWETGMPFEANWLGTTPGESSLLLERHSLVTSRMSLSNFQLPIIQ